MVATIEYHQGTFKLTPCGIDERLYQIAKPYTLVGNGAMTDFVVEKSDAVAVGGVDASQVISFVSGVVDDSFGGTFQLVCLKHVLQNCVPLGKVERGLEDSSQVIR